MKRVFDIMVSGALLVLLSPLLAVVALLVRLKLGSPVLFRQMRPGKDAKPFEMLKFRTMTDTRGPDGELLPDSARLTPFGRFLRSSSLDELPEFWNVLKGDMSLVGPRPLLMRYMSYYTNHELRRHEVRPGLTGLAQINGRNNITWEEKLSWDVEYVDTISFILDVKIIFKTAVYVFMRRGILDSAPQGPLDKYRSRNNERYDDQI